jgi:hypothetical protein
LHGDHPVPVDGPCNLLHYATILEEGGGLRLAAGDRGCGPEILRQMSVPMELDETTYVFRNPESDHDAVGAAKELVPDTAADQGARAEVLRDSPHVHLPT